MIRYLKLLHMEIGRFRLALVSLMVATFVFQSAGIVWAVRQEMARRAENLSYNGVDGSFVPEGVMSFAWVIFSTHIWYFIPVMLSIATLVGYALLIWYRDWLGRHTFVYRLLMLPNARLQVYAAKFTAILLFVFAMVGFQMLLLPVEKGIFNLLVPPAERAGSYLEDAIAANWVLAILLPRSLEQFVYSYGLGIIGVAALFTAILLERCYRWAGLIAGAAYLAVCVFAVMIPLMDDSYLYPQEYFFLELAICLLIFVISVAWSGWLLVRKVKV